MWTPKPKQIEKAELGLPILKEHGIVYLAMEERTGKTLTAILMAEETIAVNVLVLTKNEKSVKGWNKALDNYIHLCQYVVTTYGKAHHVKGEFQLVILDEAHNYISSVPKESSTWSRIYPIVWGKPIIYMSATPHAQGRHLLFHQFALCVFSPWKKFKNFYEWYKEYAVKDKAGRHKLIYRGQGQTSPDYKAVDQERIEREVEHLFVSGTRKEMGIEHDPEDEIHFIELSPPIKHIYNSVLKDKVLDFSHEETGKDYLIECDTCIKLRWTLHMLEGGTIKYTEIVDKKEVPTYLDLANTEKVDYIMSTWGDTKELVIMYQYKADKIKLERYFKKAKILQATSYAEGVDLSMHKHLVIYSQDFSTARHSQRRARQANYDRKDEIKVHFLLVKNAISHQVYKTCSENKKNFVDSRFEEIEL